ncbi:hypothetical protein B0H17DRAFT_1202247 [Mycena rosella]|uniref:Uncharacterized protein n=1 Tax=Mycena rosella TaxID=1033263 RepID=A0AAD7DE95_MYCRO|nr:hypothetical protein B0H17DRAFT_1202247 [Mycena rosella]
MFGRGRAYNDWLDPYGIHSHDPYGWGDGDGINRSSFAQVSGRAQKALDDAKTLFLNHLATVDTSGGPVTAEIIAFHLVPDMKKAFNKYVKEHGCTASQRKITREEQDKFNKTRKSLMIFSSVTVSPQAQQEYLAKNPQAASKAAAASSKTTTAGSSKTAAPGPSGSSKTAPLGSSQALKVKRTANDAQLDAAGGGSGLKKQKL